MTKLEMVQAALNELGNVPAEELVHHIARRYGARIEPRFLPVFRASLQDREHLEAARQAARAAAAACEPEAA